MKGMHRIITARQPATCTEQPLTGLDAGMPADGFCIAMVFSRPLDELQLIASLQHALDRNPYFSGRIFGMGSTLPLAIPNNEGVLFSSNAYMRDMPLFDIERPLKPHLPKFSHCITSSGFDHHTPLLQVQLTNFPNGSILGISISHALCDGVSMLEFIQSWAGYATQENPRSPPDWNRRDVQQMALGDGHDTSPQAPVIELQQPLQLNTQPVETSIFHLPGTMLEQLHERYGNRGDDVSRNDLIAAFLYLLLLRCTNGKEPLPLSIVCNVRPVLQLSASYLGNAVSLRHFEPDAGHLGEESICTIARHIRRLHNELSASGLRRDLAFWQKRVADGTLALFMPLATHLALNGGILIDNMSRFSFYDLDFGCGKPTWIDTPPPPSPAPVSRGVLMLPAPPARGGIDLHVSLPPGEMTLLHALMSRSPGNDELLNGVNRRS